MTRWYGLWLAAGCWMFNTFNRLRGKSGSAPPASAAEAAQAGAAAGGDVEAGKGGEVEHKGDALHSHGASFQSGTAKRPLEVLVVWSGVVRLHALTFVGRRATRMCRRTRTSTSGLKSSRSCRTRRCERRGCSAFAPRLVLTLPVGVDLPGAEALFIHQARGADSFRHAARHRGPGIGMVRTARAVVIVKLPVDRLVLCAWRLVGSCS